MKKYKKMQEIRIKENYTINKISALLGFSSQYIWDIEDGRKTLSYKMAYKISKILDSTPDDLFLNDHKKNKKGSKNK